MLSMPARKFLAVRRFAQSVRKMGDHHPVVPDRFKHLERLDMNKGYPLPTQLYSDAYAARQSQLNKILAGAVLFFAGAVSFVTVTDTFNYLSPPPKEVKTYN